MAAGFRKPRTTARRTDPGWGDTARTPYTSADAKHTLHARLTFGSAFVQLDLYGVWELSMDTDRHPSSRFLTVAEVAYLTRLSRATVYRLVRAGRIRAVRFGRSYRVTEAAVDEYIDKATLPDEAPDVGFP